MTELAVTLSRRELDILDTVAKCQFMKGLAVEIRELLLEYPPGSEAFVSEMVRKLVHRRLLASGGGSVTRTFSLTPLGLMNCSYTGKASSLAEGILRFIQQRLREQKSRFREYSWDDLKGSEVVPGDDEFGLAVTVMSVFELTGTHSVSFGPPPKATWTPPPDVVALRSVTDIFELYERVKGNHEKAATNHQGAPPMFDELMQDTIAIHKSDGKVIEGVRAQVSRGSIMLMDGSLVIEVGDIAERRASNGLREYYEVVEPGFYEAIEDIPAHYQMKVRSIPPSDAQRRRSGKAEPSARAGITNPAGKTGLRIFISHSSADVEIAAALIALLRSALHLRSEEIRCTSVDGYRLEGGANTEETLRREIGDSELFLGLISQRSLESFYVLFELGARWLTERPLIPLLVPGTSPKTLPGPLSNSNALSLESEAQLHQLIDEIGEKLNTPQERTAAYAAEVLRLKEVAVFKRSPAHTGS